MTVVLNIDDNEIGRYAKSRMLKAAGFDVLEGATGAEALQMTFVHRPDLVLLDVRLPDIDGFEVCRRLKLDPRMRHIPVLQVSATYVGMEHRIQGLEIGADAYLTAPMEQPVLLATIRSLLRARDAERKASESEFYHREMIASLPQLVWTCREDGSCDYVSPQWLEFTGRSPGEDLGDGWMEMVLPEDRERVEGAWMTSVAQRTPFEAEYRIRGADGGYRWFTARGRPIADDTGRVTRWFGTCTDIDELKQVQHDLAAAKEKAERATAVAEEASLAKDHFMAVLSHELRTPLTPVLVTVALLLHDPALDPETRRSLEVIRRNVELEARLIDDLLDLTRISRGKIALEKQRVDMCQVIHRALGVCMPDIEARGLELRVDEGSEAPYWIEADPGRLEQVFWNLLKNAIKFTPRGGSIRVRCWAEEGSAAAEVSDSGRGMDPQDLERLFNAFEQAENSITRQYGGLGLGLTISRNLLELHGGTIEARSLGQDQGASFIVRLPLLSSGGVSVQADSAPAAQETPSPRPLRVLLVEDHGGYGAGHEARSRAGRPRGADGRRPGLGRPSAGLRAAGHPDQRCGLARWKRTGLDAAGSPRETGPSGNRPQRVRHRGGHTAQPGSRLRGPSGQTGGCPDAAQCDLPGGRSGEVTKPADERRGRP